MHRKKLRSMELFLYILRDAVYLLCLLQAGQTDWQYRRIPNRYVGGLIFGWLFFTSPSEHFFRSVLSALLIAGSMLLVSALYRLLTRRRGFGAGDLKLVYAAGLYLGLEKGLRMIFFACLFALLYQLANKKDRGGPFPFGPFLSLAAILQRFL